MHAAGVHENFDRIVFDWPRATPYTIRRDGPRVTIDFATEADIALRALPSAKLSRCARFSGPTTKRTAIPSSALKLNRMPF